MEVVVDILINRTLVYGTLTATLVALYFGGIVLLQRVFVVLTGEKSTLAVVASTLLIVTLFNPLRRRIQSFIDRRFYRRKYDARKTLEAFSAKLRNETDLEALNSELVGVVKETMQPAHVSCGCVLRRPRRANRQTSNQFAGKSNSANFALCAFSEVRTAAVQHLRASQAQIGCLRILFGLPSTTSLPTGSSVDKHFLSGSWKTKTAF